ncbi:MAG: Gfo/Idh/MocA family oxidoreductase [Gammaproteobacteria bacterium]|nr:Gfo/Idh/MocA family oxidoreductase [Gammaproteobacteria bacterium]
MINESSHTQEVALGVVGTSWWVDAMYLPALAQHPAANLKAICGRTLTKAENVAHRWHIPHVYDSAEKLIDSGDVQALVIATPNHTHFPIAMRALHAGLHVLCEKPLALDYRQAEQMTTLAEQQGVKTMVPFTYSYMPTARYLKELIDGGYIGKPYHLNLRYYTGFGRDTAYNWRFDASRGGAGALGDIGSHFLYLAMWLYGDIVAVNAQFGAMVPRADRTPVGGGYERSEDTAIVMLSFASGAQGVLHASTVAHEPTPFGQTHHMEFHGSAGTLYSFTDWDTVQRVSGSRHDEATVKELPIPDHIWANARRDTVHNTYRDVFRTQPFMARQFIDAIVADQPLRPSFRDGLNVQCVIDAAVLSNDENRQVTLAEIT